MSYLRPNTQVPLEAPSVVPSGLSATTAFASGSTPLDASNPALDTYNVELFDCAQPYPLDSPAINACGDKLWAAFSGSRFASKAEALWDMPIEDGCPPEMPRGISLGHGIAGQAFFTSPPQTGPPQFCYLTWTEGDWKFYIDNSSVDSEAVATTTAEPLVAYLNTYLLPDTTGNIFIGPNASTASWVWGNDYYTTTAAGPVEAARLAVNMRSAETPTTNSQTPSALALTTGRADALQSCEAYTLGTSEAQVAAVASGAAVAAAQAAQQAATSDPQWQSLASATAFLASLPDTSDTVINDDEALVDLSMADAICQALRASMPDIGRVDAVAACNAYLANGYGSGNPTQLADQAAAIDPQWQGLAASISARDYPKATADCDNLRSVDVTLGRADARDACTSFGSGSPADARASFSVLV